MAESSKQRGIFFRVFLPVFLFAFCLLFCSCQTEVNYEPLLNAGAKTFAPISPDDVEIFITKRPSYPYAEMGVLSLETFSDSSSSDIYERFRVAAAKIGATGVIMLPNQTVINSVPRVNYDYYGNPIIFDTPTSDTMYKGVAIRRVESAADVNNTSSIPQLSR